ncbi:MAG: PhoH family protein [bacterium]
MNIFDTNVLLEKPDLLYKFKNITIPHVVLEELDKHKIFGNEEIKYKARKAHRVLEETDVNYKIIPTTHSLSGLERNVDNIILNYAKNSNGKIITIDKNMIEKAKAFNIPFETVKNNQEYTGWKIVNLSDEELANWYSGKKENIFKLFENQYLIIKNQNKIVDFWKFTSEGFVQPKRKEFRSKLFGKIKSRDVFQKLAMDSLINNKFTILTGTAGVAKTLLSLSYLIWGLEYGKIGKIYIIHNPCSLKSSTYLGYYTGNCLEKLLQTSIGGILSTKFGDIQKVEEMINKNELEIIPASDIRGFEIPDNCALYVTEAQNTSSYLLKTIIQRCSKDSKIIIEGDVSSQVDKSVFNDDNGLCKAIDVFKGDKDFSCVKLINIYRNRIAEVAEKM